MSVTTVVKDADALTLTLTAEFEAGIAKVWQLWADPRRLERWWGPPTYPATFQEHDLTPGGKVAYFMTGPDGNTFHGWWRVTAVDPPRSLELVDGFADQQGVPSDTLPQSTMRMDLTESGGKTSMVLRSKFASKEHMEQLLKMQMDEGLKASVGQMDALLAE